MKNSAFRCLANCVTASGILVSVVACADWPDGEKRQISKLNEARQFDLIVERILPKARLGDPEAQFSVGYFMFAAIENPDKTKPSKFLPEDAVKWVYAATVSGKVPEAASMIADGFKHGWFSLPLDKTAAECWRKVSTRERPGTDCRDPRVTK